MQPARNPGVSNPTVIHDNRVDGWTSPAGAIAYSLRGPVFAFDNQFTNGPDGGAPAQPMPPASSNGTLWIVANNQLDGKPAGAGSFMKAPVNVKTYDLDAMAPTTPAVPPSAGLSPNTSFLKPQWPTPTQIFDATTFGANGTDHLDDTAAIQAAIAAAAKAGKGAMAYLPAGAFQINNTLEISGSDFWVAGSGLRTIISYACPADPSAVGVGVAPSCPGAPPAVRVSGVRNVTIEMMQLESPMGVDQLLVQGGSGIHALKLDGIYAVNSPTNTEKWNGTGTLHVHALGSGESVHAIHLDGNLNVSDSSEGTVLVGMMIQATVHVNAAAETKASARKPTDPPALGFLTFIGLVDDYDVVVEDDQSVVIEDLYCEQLKVGHLMLSGSGSGSSPPGRVVVQGVKSESDTPAYAVINNYHGSLFYMSSMFLEKQFAQWEITQTGASEFNLTLIGNDFDANDLNPLQITLGAGGKKGSLNLIANSASNLSDVNCGQAKPPLPDKISDESLWLVHEALDDFRRLGVGDLMWNHPAVWSGRACGGGCK